MCERACVCVRAFVACGGIIPHHTLALHTAQGSVSLGIYLTGTILTLDLGLS